jgi:hypothetical protein
VISDQLTPVRLISSGLDGRCMTSVALALFQGTKSFCGVYAGPRDTDRSQEEENHSSHTDPLNRWSLYGGEALDQRPATWDLTMTTKRSHASIKQCCMHYLGRRTASVEDFVPSHL